MSSDLSKEELQSVARRPARGSLKNFLRDLRDLASFRALKATVEEFQRDDALGIAAQLAYYLILALFPFILVLVSLTWHVRERGAGLERSSVTSSRSCQSRPTRS